jgi:tetratricopeptide (TPR) repeat protein
MRRSWLVYGLLSAIMIFFVAGCANKWKTSGKIAMGQKNWEKAIGDFQKALEQDPGDGEAHFLLARAYKETGDFESMVSHLDAADSLWPKGEDKIRELRADTWEAIFNSGLKNADGEEYERACKDFQLAIAVLPERYEAYTNAGYVWQHLDNNDSALYYYTRAYEIDPGNIKILENFASLCFNIGMFAKADSLYEKILAQDPNNVEALKRRGMIASENEDYTTAVDYFARALELEPDNCDLWFRLGVLYFQQIKNNEEALKAFSRATELCPDDANPRINLNVVLLTMKRFDEAMANLETFTQDFPDECVGWDLYSQALLRKGMRKQALEANNKYEECKAAKQ